jgi:signal transduction histidine kinase
LPIHCAPGAQAELVVPLRAGESQLGVLDVQRDTPVIFGPEEIMMLQTLAGQIAMALLVSELHEKDSRRRSLDKRVQETGHALSGQMTTDEATHHILDQLAAVVAYERGSLMLPVSGDMHVVAARGFPDTTRALQMRIPIRAEGDIFEQIYHTSQPVIIDDVTQSPTWQQQDWLEINHSWMGVPLVVLDRVIGMLSLTRRAANAFTFDDAIMAQAFAGQAAILLESSRLYDQMAGMNDELERKVQARTEELANALDTMRRLDQTKADFIGVAAHELRTPLTVISGYANMLNADPILKKSPAAVTLMEGILTGVGRMLQIINNMLDVTRIDSEVLDLDKTPSHIHPLLQRVQREFKESAGERHLTLEISEVDKLPIVQIDPNMMYKVFHHLIMNAIKYTPDGGRITVTGGIVKAPGIGDAVEIQIADTGIGIALEHQQLIFEKFYQIGKLALHSSGSTKFGGGGPGLGLAIAKGIVVAHGGKIWVESPGCDETHCPGSKFFIQIPLIRIGTGPLTGRPVAPKTN